MIATWEMRIQVAELLIDWGVVEKVPIINIGMGDDPAYTHLAWLLDYPNGEIMMYNFREEDREKLELLCGPHGPTIYKILVLKKSCVDQKVTNMSHYQLFKTPFYCNLPDFDPNKWATILSKHIKQTTGLDYTIAMHQDNPNDYSNRTEYFDWHSDGLYHPVPPQYVLLHCLDAGCGLAETELSHVVEVQYLLSQKHLNTVDKLQSHYIGHNGIYAHPLFNIKGMLLASRGHVSALPGLSLHEQPSIREITDALQALYIALDKCAVPYSWSAGDTLIFDQYQYIHRRNSNVIDKDRKLIRMWFT